MVPRLASPAFRAPGSREVPFSPLRREGKRSARFDHCQHMKIWTIHSDEAADTVSISLAKPYKGQLKVPLEGIIEATDLASSDSKFSEDVR